MAPQRAKKQAASASNLISEFPAPPTSSVAASPSVQTPERMSPSKKTLKLSDAQKQALMDNLQLEVTERARKLRAQYALLSQGLRSRLEMRVNRIPSSLRKTNIMDLVEKYSEQPNGAPSTQTRPLPSATRKTPGFSTSSTPDITRGKKRPSAEISADKENAVHRDIDSDLALPKKRNKTATTTYKTPGTGPAKSRARVVSNQDAPSTVLSPKSSNSRTYPRSPVKSADEKALKPPPGPIGTIASPLKASIIRPDTRTGDRPGSRGKTGTTSTTRGKKAGTTKTAASSTRTTRARISDASSNDSAATDATTGTTIVRRAAAGSTGTKKASARTATTKSTTARAATAAKKGKENAPGVGATGRVLRTRR
ncbi:Borealin N terminal-domain-containing protein [Phyllosticta capitalensis]